MNLTVLYPQPKDVARFESDYADHLKLLHEKAGIPADKKPYTVTKFLPGPDGDPLYYQMFSMDYESPEAFKAAMGSPGMQEVAKDSHRISSGGAPIVLVGKSE